GLLTDREVQGTRHVPVVELLVDRLLEAAAQPHQAIAPAVVQHWQTDRPPRPESPYRTVGWRHCIVCAADGASRTRRSATDAGEPVPKTAAKRTATKPALPPKPETESGLK